MYKIKAIQFLFILLVLVQVGCKKDKNAQRQEETQQKKIIEVIPEKYLKVLKDMGMTVYEGTTPSDITGIYLFSPYVLQKSNNTDPNEYKPGTRFADIKCSYSSYNKTDFTLKVASKQSTANSQSEIAVVSGSGNNFTVYSMEIVTSGSNSAKLAILYSGTLDGTTIKNLQGAFIVVDDTNAGNVFVKAGTARISYDSDAISERISSLDDTKAVKMSQSNPSEIIGLTQISGVVK